jgi:hypothetical protein
MTYSTNLEYDLKEKRRKHVSHEDGSAYIDMSDPYVWSPIGIYKAASGDYSYTMSPTSVARSTRRTSASPIASPQS